MEKRKVHYMELVPEEFRQAVAEAPIAYLPLGTLEWHGEHLPIGSDGLQSQGFFEVLALEVGGVVLPPLFVGPDRARKGAHGGHDLYGMDFCTADASSGQFYEAQQLAGSAYWVEAELFGAILEAIMKQLARAGFRVVVGHGHGPSTQAFSERIASWEERYGLKCFTCRGGPHDTDALGIQVDHAAMNETSLVMALRPELVHMDRLPEDLATWPTGVGGRDPRVHASPEVGQRAIELSRDRMAAILKQALCECGAEEDAAASGPRGSSALLSSTTP